MLILMEDNPKKQTTTNWVYDKIDTTSIKALNKAKEEEAKYITEEVWDPIRKLTVVKRIKLKKNEEENSD